MARERYSLGKWRHPRTEQIRIYLNGLTNTQDKVWFEKGDRKGDALPPEYGLKLCCDKPETLLRDDVKTEIAEAFSALDLFLDKTTWARLQRGADW